MEQMEHTTYRVKLLKGTCRKFHRRTSKMYHHLDTNDDTKTIPI